MTDRRPFRLAFFIGLLLLAGCAQVRVYTWPDDVVYLDDEGVQDSMHQLAAGIGRIERLIDSEPSIASDRERLRAIDDELDRIERVAGALGHGARLEVEDRAPPRTNHLLLDEHVDEFLADVARARRMVALEPPNLYAAGRLAGSCAGCHRFQED